MKIKFLYIDNNLTMQKHRAFCVKNRNVKTKNIATTQQLGLLLAVACALVPRLFSLKPLIGLTKTCSASSSSETATERRSETAASICEVSIVVGGRILRIFTNCASIIHADKNLLHVSGQRILANDAPTASSLHCARLLTVLYGIDQVRM